MNDASCVALELEEDSHCRRLLSVRQKRKVTASIRTTGGHPMLRQAILSFPLLVAGATALAQPNPLPVYLVTEFEVIDPAGFQKFGEATTPLVEAQGGKFLPRRNKITPVVGDPPKNVTIISFPSLEKA